MSTEAHTMAGLLASAGAARLGAVTLAGCPTMHQGSGSHLFSTWTQGAIAKPATYVVFDRTNRPTRPLSELSP